ncbi:uncharacterized protein BJX67DRAFT_385452 [Aspergillus lucknowensis]|uniref:Arb2 domain-containing protein n=1 Tax=Aspergillus lucknowensis TaxID=176173 RepID=A0ABR4LDN9_9EURO
MGNSLHGYLGIKIDRDILLQDWNEILVKGCHNRTSRTLRSRTEKTDKPFNFQRPTMHLAAEGKLEILCFPGVDYVEHYAAIVATYLSISGKQAQAEVVRYIPPNPRDSMELLLESNLANMGDVDVVVVGYVHGLSSGPWIGGERADDLFAWKFLDQTSTERQDHRVALLGCRVSFWGDIAGNLVRVLAKLNKTKCVLYIGKLGTIRPEIEPNKWLATGSCSEIRGQTVTWKNVLGDVTKNRDMIIQGKHFSLPTVLDESRQWLQDHRGQFDFVDPDIGHMGSAANECGVGYGYLHIISDNLAKKYAYDLSNERLQRVQSDRRRLIAEMKEVLAGFFESWMSDVQQWNERREKEEDEDEDTQSGKSVLEPESW